VERRLSALKKLKRNSRLHQTACHCFYCAKQFTFQLERQILSTLKSEAIPDIDISFERFADYIIQNSPIQNTTY
jgi:ATP-dependent helicase/DNAse subunit B